MKNHERFLSFKDANRIDSIRVPIRIRVRGHCIHSDFLPFLCTMCAGLSERTYK
jgi:hypothetical protein